MASIRKKYTAQEKTKIALEALKGDLTSSQITAKYGAHSTQISNWKKQALEGISQSFTGNIQRRQQDQTDLTDELYKQIGQLKVELDWMKKNLNYSTETRRSLVDLQGNELSVRRQCELLKITRSNLYYQGRPVDKYSLLLMRLIDEEYTRHPFYGTRRMVVYLERSGHIVNRKRIQGLYAQMGLEAVYPKPRLSQTNKMHKIYPYLLRNVAIERANHVWSTDITYIRLKQGFVYLMAIIDWFSRYVLDFEISTSLDADFCVETLNRTLEKGQCDIFNTDQGSQFTASAFVRLLQTKNIQVSMDGKGRALDNIFVERLWRSVKYECVYLHEFETVLQAKEQIKNYFLFYNNERPHQSLGYKTPQEIYCA